MTFWKRFIRINVIPAFVLAVFLAGAAYAEVIDKVIVVVNDEVITQREFNRAFAPVEQSYAQHFQGEELKQKLEQARQGLMDQLINTKVAISYAKKAKVEIDDEELQTRINNVRSYYPTEEDFLKELKNKGTNYTEFEKDVRDQMLAQQIVEKEVASTIVITPGDIRDLYEKNKASLVAPDAVKVRTIMVRKTGPGKEKEDKLRIETIVQELNGGRDFALVAEEMSEGPFAEKGGDMGYIVKGQTLPEIEKVVFSLKKGEYSEPVETQMGYHIFLAEEMQSARQLELAEVSEFLREQLYRKRFEESLMKWMDEKRKNAYIEYKDK